MRTFTLVLIMIITTPSIQAQDLGDPNCDSLLLVSGWFSNSVKIYDGCSGEYVRNLAENGVLSGPQSIFEDQNGDVVVVSESSHELIKFDRGTLSNPSTVISPGLMKNPITVVKKDNQTIYLGGYSNNEVVEVNTQTWQKVKTILPANNGQVSGIDIGMAMGPDGMLYIPGYGSHNIIRLNPNTGASSVFVASGDQGLDRPRSILFVNNMMLVSAWGNKAILQYNLQGQFQRVVVSNLTGVAGMVQDGPGHILVTSDNFNTVQRYDLSDFSNETIIKGGKSGLKGATFVYRLEKQSTIKEVSNMRQAWVTGVGDITGKQILVTEFAATLGGAFGDDFNPNEIEPVLWGEILIDFTNCHQAEMVYASNLSIGGSAFGADGYTINRMAMNPGGLACEASGFQNVNNTQWIAGSFFGGSERNGEGFNIDVLEDNRAIVTWYTYLPIK